MAELKNSLFSVKEKNTTILLSVLLPEMLDRRWVPEQQRLKWKSIHCLNSFKFK